MPEDKKKSDKSELEETSQVINPDSANKPKAPEADKDGSLAQDSESLSNANTADFGDELSARSPTFVGKMKHFFGNLYFAIFILIVILAAGGIFVGLRLSNTKINSDSKKTQSLTDKQISELKGNTTLVGDAQQTLDIQGNAIFEGQVLMRNNLDIAGSVKVGGTLSLPAITVGGTSSFGTITVNQTLSVSGNTTLQGQLTVQKGLIISGTASVGTLSASQINVSTLQITGDLVISRHLGVNGPTPALSNGSALGSGGTASANGTDTAGTVTINTGGAPGAGCFMTLTFTNKYNSTPRVIISPSNASAAGLNYYTNRTASNMNICATNPGASSTYVFDYIVID
jgi:cytoskeletal protein CcmA (bactofilin family)